jgi:hypothetical protein
VVVGKRRLVKFANGGREENKPYFKWLGLPVKAAFLIDRSDAGRDLH